MANKTLETQEIRPLMPVETLLTEDDVALLEQRETLKAELKRLDDQLKPKIAATIDQHGTGRLMVGSRQVELKESERQTVSWKSLAYAVAEEAAIDAVKEVYTESCKIQTARVIS
jgi:hypothetical protein